MCHPLHQKVRVIVTNSNTTTSSIRIDDHENACKTNFLTKKEKGKNTYLAKFAVQYQLQLPSIQNSKSMLKVLENMLIKAFLLPL